MDSRFNFKLFDVSGTTLTELTPLFKTINFRWKKQNNDVYYRKEISSKLRFKKDDFDLLLDIDTNSKGCDNLFEICDFCFTPTGTTVFDGFLNTKKGEFDCDNCWVDISPDNIDRYTCLTEDICDEEINIFRCVNISDRVTAKTFYGDIECKTCNQQFDPIPPIQPQDTFAQCFSTADPAEYGWTVTKNEYQVLTFPQDIALLKTEYCREVFTGANAPSMDIAWMQIAPNKWARPLTTIFVNSTYEEIGGRPTWTYEYSIVGYSQENDAPLEFDNGIRMCDLIDCLTESCGHNIISNFFNCNPDNSNPTNIAYDYASQCLENIVIYDLFDVIISDGSADNNSTISNITFCKLRNIFEKMFNVFFVIDDDNNLRIEHISYFNQVQGLDLTQGKYSKYLDGKNKFKYDRLNIPARETWKWQFESSQDFASCDFIYDCSTTDRTEEFSIDCVNADIGYLTNQDEDEFSSSEGFVFMALDENDFIMTEDGILNGCLRLCSLQENLFIYDRPIKFATFNGGDIEFESTKAIKSQDKIRIPFCCEDFILFNPNQLVKTKLGWGQIKVADYDSFSETLELELTHF